jgi:hypothetical protein
VLGTLCKVAEVLCAKSPARAGAFLLSMGWLGPV